MSACPHKTLKKQMSGMQVWYVCDAWIPVEKRLPESGQVVLALMAKRNTVSDVDVLAFKRDEIDGQITWKAPYLNYWRVEVTHWMPLPDPPGECGQKFKA